MNRAIRRAPTNEPTIIPAIAPCERSLSVEVGNEVEDMYAMLVVLSVFIEFDEIDEDPMLSIL